MRNFKNIIYIIIFCFLGKINFSEAANPDIEIRKIIPPKLGESHIGQKILCHRPMRSGSPNMSIEKKDGQIIAHNYGHGGSGWTLGPGSASYVNNLLLNETKNLKQDSPITIIGAGALGLFSAYDLLQKGFINITIIADKFEFLTSHNAGGLLAPVSMNNDPEAQKIIDQIGLDTYKFYKLIAEKKHNDFEKGAITLSLYFEKPEYSGLDPYIGKVMQPPKEVILDFDNGTRRKMVAYDDGIFIDTTRIMSALRKYLNDHGVKFIQKKINRFSEIDTEFIINCSGLGSINLNNDSKLISVQGHLIMLKDQNPKDLQHIIIVYFDEGETKSKQKIKRSFYLMPKHLINSNENDVGVVGGTFIEGADNKTPNEEEFDIILQGAKRFYGIK